MSYQDAVFLLIYLDDDLILGGVEPGIPPGSRGIFGHEEVDEFWLVRAAHDGSRPRFRGRACNIQEVANTHPEEEGDRADDDESENAQRDVFQLDGPGKLVLKKPDHANHDGSPPFRCPLKR